MRNTGGIVHPSSRFSPSTGPQADRSLHIDGNLADRSRQRYSASNKFDPHASSGTGYCEVNLRLLNVTTNASQPGTQGWPRKTDRGLRFKPSP